MWTDDRSPFPWELETSIFSLECQRALVNFVFFSQNNLNISKSAWLAALAASKELLNSLFYIKLKVCNKVIFVCNINYQVPKNLGKTKQCRKLHIHSSPLLSTS